MQKTWVSVTLETSVHLLFCLALRMSYNLTNYSTRRTRVHASMASLRAGVHDHNRPRYFQGHFSPPFATGLPPQQHQVPLPPQAHRPPLYNYLCFRYDWRKRIVLEFERWDRTVLPPKKLESSYELVEIQGTPQNGILRTRLEDKTFLEEYDVKHHVLEDFGTSEDWRRFVSDKVFKDRTKAKYFHWGLGCTQQGELNEIRKIM